ncbi:MAG: hypothetical protein ACOYW7_00990 [Nitrospirota bacterium]
MKSISVSGMHSKDRRQKSEYRIQDHVFRACFILLLLIIPAPGSWLLNAVCHAEVIDRVVAYVDDTAITLSEFREQYSLTRQTLANVTEEEVVNSMINSLLLLKEARKIRLDAPSKEEMIRDYIDIKIRAPIIIREEEIERFYREHREEFKGKEYVDVRDEIELYLTELETNRRLKQHIEELRMNAEIAVQLIPQ